MEHSCDEMGVVFEIYQQIYMAKRQIIWIGDYAKDHPLYRPEYDRIYHKAWDRQYRRPKKKEPPVFSTKECFLVNHTKNEYLSFDKYAQVNTTYDEWGPQLIQPLPLLTAIGNGLGGGDYRGEDMEYVGSWAGDYISIRRAEPAHSREILPKFREL